jgi:DNA-binding GntR family transcriptional regulator
MVDKLTPGALYIQLANQIEGEIERGKYEPDDQLPSEKQMGQWHGVSRGTVRAAIELLQERGLVYTIHARGTFVRGPKES